MGWIIKSWSLKFYFDTSIVHILSFWTLKPSHSSLPFMLLSIVTCFDCPTLPCNHSNYPHCGLFSLDPCTSICHITAQPGEATYIPCLPHPYSQGNLPFFLLHLTAHSGCCFCCCSGCSTSYYDSYTVRGNPLVFLPSEECWVSRGAVISREHLLYLGWDQSLGIDMSLFRV